MKFKYTLLIILVILNMDILYICGNSNVKWETPGNDGNISKNMIIDFDNDGKEEIFLSTYYPNHLFAIDDNGILILNRSLDVTLARWENKFDIEDFNNDGIKDIILNKKNAFEVISLINNIVLWDINLKDNIGLYILKDINNDNISDVISLNYGSRQNELYEFLSINEIDGKTGRLLKCFNVSADISHTYLFYSNLGKLMSGNLGIYLNPLVTVKDINNDNELEILLCLWNLDPRNLEKITSFSFYVYSINGYLRWKFDLTNYNNILNMGKIFVNDFNNDGFSELLISGEKIILFDYKGKKLWETILNNYYFPIYDSQRDNDIILINNNSIIDINVLNGKLKWRFNVSDNINYLSSIGIRDVNKDGNNDIIFSTTSFIYILDNEGNLINRIEINKPSQITFYKNDTYVYTKNDAYKISINNILLNLFSYDNINDLYFANLDSDIKNEYIIMGPHIAAYDDDDILMWKFGLIVYRTGLVDSYDLNLDNIDDLIYYDIGYRNSWLFFKNGSIIQGINDCVVSDLNNDNMQEIIISKLSGLMVYNSSGYLLWEIKDRDLRNIKIYDLYQNGTAYIFVSRGIYGFNKLPSLVVFTNSGKKLFEIGPYSNTPYYQIVYSTFLNESYIVIFSSNIDADVFEVYDTNGTILWSKIEKNTNLKSLNKEKMIYLINVIDEGVEEFITPFGCYSLNGAILANWTFQSVKILFEKNNKYIVGKIKDNQIKIINSINLNELYDVNTYDYGRNYKIINEGIFYLDNNHSINRFEPFNNDDYERIFINDLDGDSVKEIIKISDDNYLLNIYNDKYELLNKIQMPQRLINLIIADFNNDGFKEILIYSINYLRFYYHKLNEIIHLENHIINYKLAFIRTNINTYSIIMPQLQNKGYWFTEIPINLPKIYKLNIISKYGNPIGDGYYKENTVANISIDNVIMFNNNTRLILNGWKGDIISNDIFTQINMTSSKNIICEWKTQYYLDIQSDYGLVQGAGWYDRNEEVRFSISPTIIKDNLSEYEFKNWIGDYFGDESDSRIIMNSPKQINAYWRLRYESNSNNFMLYISISIVIIVLILILLHSLENKSFI